MFVGEEDPLALLEQRSVKDLLSQVDQSFDALSQKIIGRFQIGKAALSRLQHRIENLARSSVPYVETISSWQQMSTAQSPNFLFCHDPDAANELAQLTKDCMRNASYSTRPSPLDHFVIFYQEAVGVAISDLAIADQAGRVLDQAEKSPGEVSTHYTHRMGEKMFNLKTIREFEEVREWIQAMRALCPELFKMVGRNALLEFETQSGLKRDLFVDREEQVREYVELNGTEPLVRILGEHLRNIGRQEVLQRMERTKDRAETAEERRRLQDFFEFVVTKVFQVESASSRP